MKNGVYAFVYDRKREKGSKDRRGRKGYVREKRY
jgi:hypothetical protein